MNYYIIWFTDVNYPEECENYVIVQAKDKEEAEKMSLEIAGDYVISVERYNP